MIDAAKLSSMLYKRFQYERKLVLEYLLCPKQPEHEYVYRQHISADMAQFEDVYLEGLVANIADKVMRDVFYNYEGTSEIPVIKWTLFREISKALPGLSVKEVYKDTRLMTDNDGSAFIVSPPLNKVSADFKGISTVREERDFTTLEITVKY